MEPKEVKRCMRVTPHSKTPDGRVQGLENSVVWKIAQDRGQNYLYVVSRKPVGDYPECRLSADMPKKGDSVSGDYFMCRDFERYEKG